MEKSKNQFYPITIKGNYAGLGSEVIKNLADANGIDLNIYYVDMIRVKEGSWDVAAKQRDQELKWTREEDEEGNPLQIMTGYSKHFPEFMVNPSKTNSVEVTFRRKPIEANILESFKEIIKDMPVFIPPTITKKVPGNNGVAGELTTFDAHFGKLAAEIETGYRNYDLNIATKDYVYVSDRNLDLMAPHKPEKIFYILGQDMYHIDNMAGHTTKGEHTLDVDGRITKIHKKVFTVSKDNIHKASKIAPVEVIWIPGNHDFLASFMLALALKEHFRNYSRVTVDISENPRKARLWGNLLVGWTHRIVGKHTVWSNELAQQFPKLWADSVFREWHHGDQHKKTDVKITPIFTSGGVICRQITALSPVDKWHTDNVFTDAVPGGEAFLWSKEEGVFANFITWTGQYDKNRNKLINKHVNQDK